LLSAITFALVGVLANTAVALLIKLNKEDDDDDDDTVRTKTTRTMVKVILTVLLIVLLSGSKLSLILFISMFPHSNEDYKSCD
jgi:peptidoglycan biosynthesis protein MviN/MurJ (putative lipid II flippase)